MIDLHTYFLFIGAVIVLVLAPGPDMAYMLTRTIVQGRRAGMLAAAGINTGAYVHVFASVVGLTAILASSAFAFTAIKWIGACYLVWIGIQALVSKAGSINLEDNQAVTLSNKAIFWQGFWSDVLNPKVAIFFLAFLPQFVDANSKTLTVSQQLLLLGVSGNIVGITLNLAIIYMASAATASLRQNQSLVKWMNKAAGTVFVGLGLRLAGEKL
ncbi:MAG TPA: LysE family translocator [Candidatus Acidoferrum sp.]|nr:LysE family translocator [Candidatus Acidoferrum sp.]